MNLIALLLTYLLFAHPQIFLILAIIAAIVFLIVNTPGSILLFLVIMLGIIAICLFVK